MNFSENAISERVGTSRYVLQDCICKRASCTCCGHSWTVCSIHSWAVNGSFRKNICCAPLDRIRGKKRPSTARTLMELTLTAEVASRNSLGSWNFVFCVLSTPAYTSSRRCVRLSRHCLWVTDATHCHHYHHYHHRRRYWALYQSLFPTPLPSCLRTSCKLLSGLLQFGIECWTRWQESYRDMSSYFLDLTTDEPQSTETHPICINLVDDDDELDLTSTPLSSLSRQPLYQTPGQIVEKICMNKRIQIVQLNDEQRQIYNQLLAIARKDWSRHSQYGRWRLPADALSICWLDRLNYLCRDCIEFGVSGYITACATSSVWTRLQMERHSNLDTFTLLWWPSWCFRFVYGAPLSRAS